MNYKTVRRWEAIVFGTLAEEGNSPGQRPIFINATGELQFAIRIISTPPNSFPKEQQLVTCFGSDLEIHGFEDDVYDPNVRIRNCFNFLNDKLLVFKIEQNRSYFTARDLKIMAQKPSYTVQLGYTPIPLYHEEGNRSFEQFLTHLNEGQYIGRNEGASQEPEDTPRYLLYETADGRYFAVGEFDTHHYAQGGFSFSRENDRPLTYFPIEQEIVKEIYISNDLAFVEIEEEHTILMQLQSGESRLVQSIVKEALIEKVEIESIPIIDQEAKVSEVGSANTVTLDHTREVKENFMSCFIDEAKKMQLLYNEEDLYNFYMCMKTGGLTIITGLSGSGKTQLTNAYQKALQQNLGQYLVVPVNPAWAEPSHVFGYVDLEHYVYRPSSTGLVELLMAAEQQPEKTFIICLDDLNVAKVDYYFSLLLAAVEKSEKSRTLTLYNKEIQSKIYNGDRYPAEITIGSNVLFTGTASIDENTHPFSNKVLDYANVMALSVERFSKRLTIDNQMTLTEDELDFLWEVHTVLTSVSAQFGISPRVVKQIDRYVQNVLSVEMYPINRQKAFDLQFVQKILPKVRGSEQMLQNLFGIYDEEKRTVHHSELIALFDQYATHSTFEKSRAFIVEKSKELVRSGYTF